MFSRERKVWPSWPMYLILVDFRKCMGTCIFSPYMIWIALEWKVQGRNCHIRGRQARKRAVLTDADKITKCFPSRYLLHRIPRRYQSKHQNQLQNPRRTLSPFPKSHPKQDPASPGPNRRMEPPLITDTAPTQGARPIGGPTLHAGCCGASPPGSCALPHLKAEGGVRSAGSRESLWSGNPLSADRSPGLLRTFTSVSVQEVLRRCSGET